MTELFSLEDDILVEELHGSTRSLNRPGRVGSRRSCNTRRHTCHGHDLGGRPTHGLTLTSKAAALPAGDQGRSGDEASAWFGDARDLYLKRRQLGLCASWYL